MGAAIFVKSLGLVLVLAALVACGTEDGQPPSSPPSSVVASAAASSPATAALPSEAGSALTIADAASCDVTEPVRAPAAFADRLFGSSAAYGNDSLWVGGLGEGGVILADPRFVEPDGSIGWKLGWWRIEPGQVVITGRRLDAVSPILRGEAGQEYGESGFQPSGVIFPTEGCWEVTGTLGEVALSFVTFVLRT
jgi:hypothetical protein